MSDTIHECRRDTGWNVLTDRWLDVMSLKAEAQPCSPLEALSRSSDILRIATASPLDLFATYRFLLTLLYWKADAAGGVQPLRESLLRGKMPQTVCDAIEAEVPRFRLFDDKAPFLQDPTACETKKPYSAGSPFAEFASGTNIAHFHHGDDKKMRLCLRCATIGMLRVIPWSQAGGAGVTPAIHGAPPIMAIATGQSLAVTLGLNFVPLPGNAGLMKWSGRFEPTDKDAAIPYLEALTWNPRRVHLLSPEIAEVCWRCGQTGIAAVGPIKYLKNEKTNAQKGKDNKTIPFTWHDPSAFYAADRPYATKKSCDEKRAKSGDDLSCLLSREAAPEAAVVVGNPDHQEWLIVIPCTTGKDKKTFDNRQLELTGAFLDAVRSNLRAPAPPPRRRGLDGWKQPRPAPRNGGTAAFVRAAARFLTPGDWAVMSAAAYQQMHDSPAAFDLFSGLLWPLRGKVAGLPSKNALWLVLKLMAVVPSRARRPVANPVYNPLQCLPTRQRKGRREDRSGASISYPVSFPRGLRLEAVLRSKLESNMRKRKPEPVDWPGLCHGLNQLID